MFQTQLSSDGQSGLTHTDGTLIPPNDQVSESNIVPDGKRNAAVEAGEKLKDLIPGIEEPPQLPMKPGSPVIYWMISPSQ